MALAFRIEQGSGRRARVGGGQERSVELLIDDEGKAWRPADDIVEHAVCSLGFIHLRTVGRSSVVVSLRLDLVSKLTMASSFYEIAGLFPTRLIVCPKPAVLGREEIHRYPRAILRIEELVAAAQGITSPGPDLLNQVEDGPGARGRPGRFLA
jgi:hypothetical protein